ncbi:unnamed protein product [Polarella glacialis]|uniref:Methyltransferase FkbM domain-containing protein n=1 Tax=Polarella glacialis TaxID=89957 RepID=A0A813HCJ5_POLGL|nr:unnamed protein product [Polarella glacialis]
MVFAAMQPPKPKPWVSLNCLVLGSMACCQVCFFAFYQTGECHDWRLEEQQLANRRVQRLAQSPAAVVGKLRGASKGGSDTSLSKSTPQAAAVEGSITHAPYGECVETATSLHGAKHPDCRWQWDEVPSPRLIVELGGNFGEDLQAFLRRYPTARVHSFEPVSKYFRHLSNEFANESRAVLYNVGASDADGSASFRIDGDMAASSQYGTVNHGEVAKQYEEVVLRDVDALLKKIVASEKRQIDVLSLNCEGCEYAVLERLADKGWLGRIGIIQVSWHASATIPRRLERRCHLSKELHRYFRVSYIADFGWVGFSSWPRPYALEERFVSLPGTSAATLGHANGLPQAPAGIDCIAKPQVAAGLPQERDPAVGHMTYPQTMQHDRVLQIVSGGALELPLERGESPLIVKVSSGAKTGSLFDGLLAANPGSIVHSFEPVTSLRETKALPGTARLRVWDVGLAAENRSTEFRVWAAAPVAGRVAPSEDRWEGRLEDARLWDADFALGQVQLEEARVPDLLYLNCEGCEYEVLQRLVDSGRLASLPRLAIFWHAGGASWKQRCSVDGLLKRTHRLVRAELSLELWVSRALPQDPWNSLGQS